MGSCHVLDELPPGSAQLYDIEAGDDAAVGLPGGQPCGDSVTRDRQDGQRVFGGTGESADEAGVGAAGVPAADAPGTRVAVTVDSSYVCAHSGCWVPARPRRGGEMRGGSVPAGLRYGCAAPRCVGYRVVGSHWRVAGGRW